LIKYLDCFVKRTYYQNIVIVYNIFTIFILLSHPPFLVIILYIVTPLTGGPFVDRGGSLASDISSHRVVRRRDKRPSERCPPVLRRSFIYGL